jgi:hypothetical protein
LHAYGLNEIHVAMLPFLSILYIVSYTGFLLLMKFSPEDHIVWDEIGSKLRNKKIKRESILQ